MPTRADELTKTPRFVRKLYQIVTREDPALVGWSHDGRAFYIREPARFQHRIKTAHHLGSLCTFRQNLRAHGFLEVVETGATVTRATGMADSPATAQTPNDSMERVVKTENVGCSNTNRPSYSGTVATKDGDHDRSSDGSTSARTTETFFHPFFVRGHPDLLTKIAFDASAKHRCCDCKRRPNDAGTKCASPMSAPRAITAEAALAMSLSVQPGVGVAGSTPTGAGHRSEALIVRIPREACSRRRRSETAGQLSTAEAPRVSADAVARRGSLLIQLNLAHQGTKAAAMGTPLLSAPPSTTTTTTTVIPTTTSSPVVRRVNTIAALLSAVPCERVRPSVTTAPIVSRTSRHDVFPIQWPPPTVSVRSSSTGNMSRSNKEIPSLVSTPAASGDDTRAGIQTPSHPPRRLSVLPSLQPPMRVTLSFRRGQRRPRDETKCVSTDGSRAEVATASQADSDVVLCRRSVKRVRADEAPIVLVVAI